MNGKTIRIYLVEGTPNSIFTAEIINWTGKVIVAPRSQLANLATRVEAKRTGVYVLTGDAPDNPTKERVYIGESDNVFKRLTEHNNDDKKDFWTRTALIISKDENLTKAHIRYLESQLIQLAQQAKRAILDNGTDPGKPPLPESDTADMEFFLSQVQMLLPVLGFSFALPVPTPTSTPITDATQKDISAVDIQNISPIFCMKVSGADATAQEINGEFVVLKGSTARKDSTDSLSPRNRALRELLIQEGKLINLQNEAYLSFNENVSFKSPSAAAAAISGASYNGRIAWKVVDSNQTYKEWQEAQIEKAEFTSVSTNILLLLKERYSNWLRPEIVKVRILQREQFVFLEIVAEKNSDEYITRTNLNFIEDGDLENSSLFFPPSRTAQENAKRFVEEFDPYSIINCTELFTHEGCEEVAEQYWSQQQHKDKI